MVSEEQATISCKMLDLPPEIVLQISTMLNWQDILRLRQTCKAMSEASRTKMLWTHLFSLHKDPWLQAPRLERPIEQYSSTELEALVLRWISSGKTCEEIIHKGSNYKGGVIQTREIKSQKVECMCLIKGGRWLLTAFRNGSVYYCDLNSATLQKVPLIQKQVNLKTHPDSRIFMTVDVDEDSSVLSFNIALIFIQARSSEPPYETGWQFFNSNLSKVAKKAQQVQIWHVNLVVEESSRVTDGLAATKLTSFLLDPNVVWIHSYSLLGSHIALGIHCYYLEPNGIKECYCTMIIEWMRVHEGSLDYPRYCFSFEDPICAMHLLPQKRVFSINWLGDLYLQDYSTLPEITGILWSPDELEPLWTAPFKCRNIAFSTPQTLDGENQLFVLLPSGFNELFGILIYGLGNPLGAEHPVSIISLNERYDSTLPIIELLGQWPRYERWEAVVNCTFGAASLHLPQGQQKWCNDGYWYEFEKHRLFSDSVIPVFDEDSGRVIFSLNDSRRYHKVVDLSTLPLAGANESTIHKECSSKWGLQLTGKKVSPDFR